MTAATVTSRYPGVLAEEHVNITLSDGETFVSKLGKPLFIQITSAEDMTNETNSVSYSVCGRTITMYADGVTDKLTTLTVRGYL